MCVPDCSPTITGYISPFGIIISRYMKLHREVNLGQVFTLEAQYQVAHVFSLWRGSYGLLIGVDVKWRCHNWGCREGYRDFLCNSGSPTLIPSKHSSPMGPLSSCLTLFLKGSVPFNTVTLGAKMSTQEHIRRTDSGHSVGLNKSLTSSSDIANFPSFENGCGFNIRVLWNSF